MANLAAGDIVEFRIYCASAEQTSINVMHYRVKATTGDSRSLLAVVGNFGVAMNTALPPLLSEWASFEGVQGQVISPTLTPSATDLYQGTPGQGAGDQMPRQVCGFLQKQVAVVGHGTKGRFYVPFPGEVHGATQDSPSADYVTRLFDLRAALMGFQPTPSGGDTVEVEPVIWRRALQEARVITAIQPKVKWATQRRRGSFGKANISPF